MGTFDRRADDQAMEANGTTSVHDIEFDRVLRVQGIDPEEFNRAARDGLFREMLSNFSE